MNKNQTNKKSFIFACLVVFSLFLTFIIPQETRGYIENIDQQYWPTIEWSKNENIPTTPFVLGQTFKPTINRITQIYMRAGGGPESTFNLTITKTDLSILVSKDVQDDEVVIEFILDSPLEVIPGNEYVLWLSETGSHTCPYGNAVSDGDYSDGYAFIGGVPDVNKDFHFQVFGYTESSNQQEQLNAQPPPPPINPPLNLIAIDNPNDQGGTINISWEASKTTDIDGYKLLRSTIEGEDYQEVKQFDNNILDYKNTGLETNKDYFYIIKAYKDNEESSNSNEVSAKALDNLAPFPPARFKLTSAGEDFVKFEWDKNKEVDLAGYKIKYGTKKEEYTEEVDIKKETKIKIKKLDKEKVYYFIVVAYDINDNESESSREIRVDLNEEMVEVITRRINWPGVASIVSGFILFLIGVLIAYKKKIWPFREKMSKITKKQYIT